MEASLPDCPNIHVPRDIFAAVVRVESANNPFAIGVVGGRLVRQPKNLNEALATIRDLENRGYNYSVGMSQVNRGNFAKYGIATAVMAFDVCANLEAGSKILQECFSRSSNDWGKAFSCYYSGNFVTGYKHGYVQKVTESFFSALPKNNAVEPIKVLSAGLLSMTSPYIQTVTKPTVSPSRRSGGLLTNEIAETEAASAVLELNTVRPVINRFTKDIETQVEIQTGQQEKKQTSPLQNTIQVSSDNARVF
jgi:type IV secretion system protein VirB1